MRAVKDQQILEAQTHLLTWRKVKLGNPWSLNLTVPGWENLHVLVQQGQVISTDILYTESKFTLRIKIACNISYIMITAWATISIRSQRALHIVYVC